MSIQKRNLRLSGRPGEPISDTDQEPVRRIILPQNDQGQVSMHQPAGKPNSRQTRRLSGKSQAEEASEETAGRSPESTVGSIRDGITEAGRKSFEEFLRWWDA